jgi:phycocyanin-associated rod linker protein
MVVIKQKRDFSDLNRVSYAADNASSKRPGKAATSTEQYKENICASMAIGIGPRHHEICPFSAVNDQFAARGSDALEATIAAAYKQIFGNLGLRDNQRCRELEAQLCNGDLSVRDFVAGLAKSDAYKESYFFKVSPMRGIELNLKHLLGRPPVNQAEVSRYISLIAEHGFDALVDQITRSGEYLEVFGTDTVPYARAFKSEAGFYCSTFVNMGEVCPANASADSTTQSRSLLVVAFKNARSLSTGRGSYDTASFSYSKAVTDPSSRAFQRMYQSKTAKTWG